MKLRAHLASLALGGTLPVLLLSIALALVLVEKEQDTFQRAAQERTRAVMTAVDAELRGHITTLEALATSRPLETGDLEAFGSVARRTLPSQPAWLNLVLVDSEGRQAVNTRFESALKREPGAWRPVFETRRPWVDDVAVRPNLGEDAVAVRVPVRRGGKVEYALSAIVKLAAFDEILRAQKLAPDWLMAVADRNHIFVARIPRVPPGRRGSEALSSALAKGGEGWFRGPTVEGRDTYQAYSVSPWSGWAVGIAFPAAEVLAPARRAALLAAAGGLLAIAVALALSLFIGRRIAGGAAALAAQGSAFARGAPPAPAARSGVDELDLAGASLFSAQRELAERTELLRAISDNALDVIYAKDRESRMRFANPAALRLIGKPLEAVLGRTDPEFLEDKEGASRILENDRQVISSGAALAFEERIGERIFASQKAPYRDSRGEVIGLLGISRDITESRRLADELTRTLESINDGFYSLDGEWRFVYVNAAAEALLARPRKSLFGTVFWQAYPDTLGTAAEHHLRAAARGEVRRFEYFFPPWQRWFYNAMYPRPGGGVSVFFHEITERKRAEEALARERGQLQAVFHALAEGIAVFDMAGRAVLVNDTLARLTGYRAATDMLLDVEDFTRTFRLEELSGETVELQRRPVSRALRGESFRDWELRLTRLDTGAQWIVSYSGEPVRDASGAQILALVVVRDITREKEAQERLRELAATLESRVAQRTRELVDANAQLEAFTYTVSHDLRAPLRGIQGFAQALVEDYAAKLGGDGADFLARIARAAQRMEELIEDLLAYSRLARQEMPLKALDLDEVVAAALEALAGRIAASQAAVTVRRPLGAVLGNRPMLVQALQNLLDNAIKFVPPRVRADVEVSSETDNGRVVLSVRDNGIGVAAEHQERLFRVFERLHSEETYPGTGIGLAIVQRAVERMGGACGVESAPGRGSRFWIALPEA